MTPLVDPDVLGESASGSTSGDDHGLDPRTDDRLMGGSFSLDSSGGPLSPSLPGPPVCLVPEAFFADYEEDALSEREVALRLLATADSFDAPSASRSESADFKDPPRVRDPEVFKRFHEQEPRCLACGSGWHGDVHAHHLLSRSQGGGDVAENLIPLCALHHGALHSSTPDKVFVTAAIAGYLESEAGAEALAYLRSKRSDGWIEKRFGVELS